MDRHPSSLVLDELAVGLPADKEAQAHTAACAGCSAKVEERRALTRQLPSFPRYRPTLERIQRAPVPARPSLRWLGVLIPLAAVVALVIRIPSASTDHVKGAPAVPVVSVDPGRRR